jgi:hypothetical protein
MHFSRLFFPAVDYLKTSPPIRRRHRGLRRLGSERRVQQVAKSEPMTGHL